MLPQPHPRGVPRVPEPAREGLPLHVVLDNSSTPHRPRSNSGWSAIHACSSTSTSTRASWMTMVAIWFSIRTKQQVRRGVYHDCPELIAAIEHYFDSYNDRAQRFVGPRPPTRTPRSPPNDKTLQRRCTRQLMRTRLRDPVDTVLRPVASLAISAGPSPSNGARPVVVAG